MSRRMMSWIAAAAVAVLTIGVIAAVAVGRRERGGNGTAERRAQEATEPLEPDGSAFELRKTAVAEQAAEAEEEGELLESMADEARVVRAGSAAAAPASTDASTRLDATPARRLGFPRGDDWEPAIAADDSGHVYAFWTHYGDDPACSVCANPHMELQTSSDRGRTWSAPRPLLPRSSGPQYDPQIAVDPADGRTVYASYMLGDKSSMYVAKSTDFGRTWRTSLIEHLQRGLDKDILAVRGDDVYVAYNAVMKIYVSASHDGGETWHTYQIDGTTNSKLGWSLSGGGAVDTRGTVYFSWEGYEASGKPSGDVNLFISRSTDGGRTWRTFVVDSGHAPPICGKSCGWAYWGEQTTMAVDRRGTVYVLYNANTRKFGVDRMYFARSTDGGRTWDRRRDVSTAPRGSNNLFPAIAARGAGDVRIAWQDDRNGFDDGDLDRSARWNTYYRESSNGGRSWSREVKLSRFVDGYRYKRSEPRPGYLQPYGDYFELDIDDRGQTQAIWGEGVSWIGPGNVWYARVR